MNKQVYLNSVVLGTKKNSAPWAALRDARRPPGIDGKIVGHAARVVLLPGSVIFPDNFTGEFTGDFMEIHVTKKWEFIGFIRFHGISILCTSMFVGLH